MSGPAGWGRQWGYSLDTSLPRPSLGKTRGDTKNQPQPRIECDLQLLIFLPRVCSVYFITMRFKVALKLASHNHSEIN